MLVGNYTPDDIDWEHIGQVGTLKSGFVEDFPDPRANHILTKFGPRGILKVEWDKRNDEKAYQSKAIEMYKRFWHTQIAVFNQGNEARRNENRPYVFPTKSLQQKSDELGMILIEPWKAVKTTESATVNKVLQENEALKESLKSLQGEFRELIELVKEINTKEEKPVSVNTAEILQQFKNLSKDNFRNWVIENKSVIPDFPVSVYNAVQGKWRNFYKKDLWPIELCRGPQSQ